MKRRTFVKGLGLTAMAGSFSVLAGQGDDVAFTFGVCNLHDAGKLKELGYQFIEGDVDSVFKPNLSDEEYKKHFDVWKQSALPIRSCRGFIPSSFRLTGPAAEHEKPLAYAVKACQRADELGVPYIVFGSGGVRQVPDGFPIEQGKAQFIEFCKKLAGRIEDCKVTVVLEPLASEFTNLLNSVAEGIEYVDAVNQPRIQLLADLYHMLKDKESMDSIRKAGKRLRHCHIAELKGRMAPGTAGEDLTPFFKALKDIQYKGGVSCECNWPKGDLQPVLEKALSVMRTQAGKA